MQAVPQPPQLVVSVIVSTQVPPHAVCPVGQVTELRHVPAMQVCPVVQVFPQVPQLAASVIVSTQVDPQRVWPVGQSGVTHMPPVQL